jgi:hypothetical protein
MTNTALNPTAVPGSPFYSQGIDIRDPAGWSSCPVRWA